MSKTEKPKQINNKDIQEAISIEAAELIREEKDLIFKRARKRLREKFGR